MTAAVLSGILLGLAGGLSPGPLLALVLTQTLRHGPREGCRVAAAPLLTDLPIILAALAFAARLSSSHVWMGVLSGLGGFFVSYLAFETLRARASALEPVDTEPRSWRKGVLTNLLNPNPWLFWITVGAPALSKALAGSRTAAAVFLGSFYLMLVGSKVLLAVAVGRSRQFLSGPAYRWIMRFLGAALGFYAILLARDALRCLGVI